MNTGSDSLPEPPPWPAGTRRLMRDEVDSTNAEAARLSGSGQLDAPCWILALRQTAGRGRRGRRWEDQPGNFAATLALPLQEPPARLALRSFVAALAVDDALQGLGLPAAALGLKWPNDVLLHGGKLCGILLETLPRGGLAIGVGLNLAAAPQVPVGPGQGDAPRPVSLAEEGALKGVTPERFLAHLAPAYAVREAQLAAGGFGPIRSAWLARAHRLGRPILARTMREDLRGIFETVDAQGRLVLSTPEGRQAIPAADIHFPKEG